MRKLGVMALGLLVGVQGAGVVSAQALKHRGTNPPAVFADPDRKAKLSAAFPEIDRMIEELEAAKIRFARQLSAHDASDIKAAGTAVVLTGRGRPGR